MTTPPSSDGPPSDPGPDPAWASPDSTGDAPAPDFAWAPPDAARDASGPTPTGLPPTEPSPAGPPVPRRTNRFAIVALVTGLLGLIPLAAGFAVAAFVRAGRRGEKGNGLAVGGLAASLAWVAAIAVIVTVGPLSPDTSLPGAREDGRVAVTDMRPGDCFSGFEETPAGMFVKPLPCTTPHQGEISAEAELPDVPYPGRQEVRDRAWTVCRERTEFLERSRYGGNLRLFVAPPDEDAWKDGDRAAKCVMRYTGPGLLPASLDQTIETRSQYMSELAPGDCLEGWNEQGDQSLVPCTRKHEYEVLAVYTMRGDKYPGDKGMEDKALKGCAERAAKVWGTNPPSDIADMAYAAPNKEGWEQGDRLVFCLVTGRHGPLKRSVVPH